MRQARQGYDVPISPPKNAKTCSWSRQKCRPFCRPVRNLRQSRRHAVYLPPQRGLIANGATTPPPGDCIPFGAASTALSGDTSESRRCGACTPTWCGISSGSHPSKASRRCVTFEPFTAWDISYFPGIVKLWKSPRQSRGLYLRELKKAPSVIPTGLRNSEPQKCAIRFHLGPVSTGALVTRIRSHAERRSAGAHRWPRSDHHGLGGTPRSASRRSARVASALAGSPDRPFPSRQRWDRHQARESL